MFVRRPVEPIAVLARYQSPQRLWSPPVRAFDVTASPPSIALASPGDPLIDPGDAMCCGDSVKFVVEFARDNRLCNRVSHRSVHTGDHRRDVRDGLQDEAWSIIAIGVRDWDDGS